MDPAIKDVLKTYVGSILKKRIIKMAVDQAMGVLIKTLPFMAWGPLGPIAVHFITKAVIFFMDKTVIGAHVLYIYGDTHFDKVKVQKIIRKFNELGKEITDEQAKQLDKELGEAGRELIRFGSL